MPNRQAVTAHSESEVVPCFQAPFLKGFVKDRGLLDHDNTALVNCMTPLVAPSQLDFVIVQ